MDFSNRNSVFIFLFLIMLTDIWAQEIGYQFKNISTANGLSQSSVIAIEQDRLGQMWLGTRDGLNRYDGNAFKIFRNDPKDTTSISNSDILSILEDVDGKLWIGTYNGLNRYDPIKNVFRRYFHSSSQNSLINNTIWCLTEMRNGELWVGTSNGLSIYDKEKDSFRTVTSIDQKRVGLPSKYVLSILEDDEGITWVGTSKGLCKVKKLSDGTFSFQTYTSNLLKNDLFVQDMLLCDTNILRIATKGNGVLRFDTVTEQFSTDLDENSSKKPGTDVRELKIDTEGRLWLGTYNGLRVIAKDGAIQKIVNEPYAPKSLANDYVKSLFVDKKGSVWVGSYYGGVDVWDDYNNNFINYTHTPAKNGLGHKVVSSIVSDTKQKIYFGTEGNGITIFDTKSGNATYLNSTEVPEIQSDNIKSLFLHGNQLWIGSFNGGVYVYDTDSEKIDLSAVGKELQLYLKESGVHSIKNQDENSIWLGSFGKGLIHYNVLTKEYVVFTDTTLKTKALTNNRIRSLLVDTQKNVWAGTQSGLNLLEYDGTSTGIKQVKHFFYDEIKQSGDDILALFQDSNGTIWACIRAKGLFKFNGQDFDAIPIDKEQNITSVYAILEDADHLLWMSSNLGIIKYDPAAKKSIVYSQKDGLAGNEFNSGAALKLNDTKFYFGGTSGVSYFDIKKLAVNEYAPQVILTDLKVKNRSVSPIDDQDILQKSISYTKSLTLDYDKANFSINFAIPNFIRPGSNRYRYRMVGLEDAWTSTDRPSANYTIQNPGDYVFEVKGANNDGVWNAKPTSLKITVKPAPWRSIWAFALYGVLIALALSGLAWIIRSRTKLQHQLEIEHLRSERNIEIHNAKLQFFTNISHEFRTPLTLISGPLQQLLEDYRGSSFMYKKLLVIESNANHLLQLINRLMDFRKFENQQFKLEAAEGNIVKFLHEIFLSFSEFAKDGGYNYTFTTSSEKILIYYDRSKLEQVFYNLISNAFKYTPKNGSISVKVSEKQNKIKIQVEDSGVGIPDKFKERIFDRFFEINGVRNTNRNLQKGTGIGLSIAKKIVELHHGSIDISSNEEEGSIFSVKLLSGRGHLSAKEIIADFKFSDDIALYASQLKNPLWETEVDFPYALIHDKNKETVLIVEDNKTLRSFMRDLLKDQYNILEAGDGKEAMKKALHHVPDLIVSDVMMPLLVGTELCAQIKANLKTSHIPVILLTSRTSLVYKFEGLENGADDYISKPFNLKEFQLRIKNLIESTKRLKKKFSENRGFVPKEITVSAVDEKLLEKALQIVEENISNEQFDIPAFSNQLGVSRSILFTKIKAWTNFTPNEFIQELRMKRALQLLELDNLNISQISYKVGFRNPKYFSKLFQKRFGETPSKYLKKFSDDLVKPY